MSRQTQTTICPSFQTRQIEQRYQTRAYDQKLARGTTVANPYVLQMLPTQMNPWFSGILPATDL
ncbi:hypothetical protein [Psittacid alphaherpesvirus 5]|uniref:Uncharacterized protein n=1 Tax=Psittacid alphaherpesvirus 5 TaxID=2972693 RepID=A0A5P9JP69_9ALPH|nr:hypothetical protein QKU09_gp78 [Psittacid alphaherpesvirus 5]QFU14622.1 hypothetical protein [Psittacid alphaherpesvirus 5]UOO01093.1 hypothetical protein [Psittacid alphaherpesvirus 5]